MSGEKKYTPDGYKMVGPDSSAFMTIAGAELFEKLNNEAENRDPDRFDMYIYNDFLSYAILDLVDREMVKLHAKATKKEYPVAYSILEALTAFMQSDLQWAQCDDGERVDVTNKAYGALLIHILKGITKAEDFNPDQYLNLESILQGAADLGEQMREQGCNANYDKFCKAVALRLFKDKSTAADAEEVAQGRREEWFQTLPANEREEVKARFQEADEDEDEDAEDKTPWYHGAKSKDENVKESLTRLWKEYRDHVRNSPSVPLRGPPKWDISTWTAKEKKPFLFSEMD